ncbi:hypothetical protein HDV00_012228 [Rhizophlyctis rosea]|nr:hypothetical protein HDV00_012228 [Rhizophlyctis rosea]
MDLLAARMGGGFSKPAPPPKPSRVYRVHVPLNFDDVTKNVFDYAELVRKQKEQEGLLDAPALTSPDGSPGGGTSDEEKDESSDSEKRPEGGKRVRRDEYDYDDEFIDDSDLFFAEVTHAPPSTWDYGYFVWRGPVENYFKEYNEKIAAQEKEREEAAGAAATAATSKKKGKKKQSKKAAANTPPDTPADGSAGATTSPSPTKTKKKRASPTTASSKKAAAAAEKEKAAAESTSASLETPSTPAVASTTPMEIDQAPNGTTAQKHLFPEAQNGLTTPSTSPPQTQNPSPMPHSSEDDDFPLRVRGPTAAAEPASEPIPIASSPKKRPREEDGRPDADHPPEKKKKSKKKDKDGDKKVDQPQKEKKDRKRKEKSSVTDEGKVSSKKAKKHGEMAGMSHAGSGVPPPPPLPLAEMVPEVVVVHDVAVPLPGGSEKKKEKVKSVKEKDGKKAEKKDKGHGHDVHKKATSDVNDHAHIDNLFIKLAGLMPQVKIDKQALPHLPSEINSTVDKLVRFADSKEMVNDAFTVRLAGVLKLEVDLVQTIVKLIVLHCRMQEYKDPVNQFYGDFKTAVRGACTELTKQHKVAFEKWKSEGAKDPQPEKKFKWTDTIRTLMWNILCTEWLIAQADNERNLLRGRPSDFTESAVRRAVYSKLCDYFEKGWMTTDNLSREYSAFKRKVQQRYENISPATFKFRDAASGGVPVPDPFTKFTKPRKSNGVSGEVKVEGDGKGAGGGKVGVPPSPVSTVVPLPPPGKKDLSREEDGVHQGILESVSRLFAAEGGMGNGVAKPAKKRRTSDPEKNGAVKSGKGSKTQSASASPVQVHGGEVGRALVDSARVVNEVTKRESLGGRGGGPKGAGGIIILD